MQKLVTNYQINDVLEFKKSHPCGSNKWKVIRCGVDMKLECLGCQRVIIIPRVDLNKKVKKIIREEEK